MEFGIKWKKRAKIDAIKSVADIRPEIRTHTANIESAFARLRGKTSAVSYLKHMTTWMIPVTLKNIPN